MKHSDRGEPPRVTREAGVARAVWSATIQSRAGQREGIFVMQPAKDRFASDGIRLSAAMARIGNREDEGTDRRIGNTGTPPHVWASAVVMGDPGF
jgi:hypothetical protein